MDLTLVTLALASLLCIGRAIGRASAERVLDVVVPGREGSLRVPHPATESWRTLLPWVAGAVGTAAGALLGWMVMGPIGLVFAGLGATTPSMIRRRRRRKVEESLEGQVGELASTVALAVRSGLSISQALEAAAEDAEPPLRPLLEAVLAEQRVGSSLEAALAGFGEAVGTDDARLLVLILLTHARTGGNIGVALNEVAATIRHRVEARRELRALTAQGRISGTILGALPIGFFALMAMTSSRDLADVYRSHAGAAMILLGLGLELLAYLWIRRLLRIEV